MLSSFHKYNTENHLFRKEDKLLVAVSGGVDSVVLCHLLSASGSDFCIAHVNFGLRGPESDEDETFVLELATRLNVPVFVKKADTQSVATRGNISIQMAAREIRYQWFYELAEKESCQYILTAHHSNDVTETVLLNLTRGTGISGLHGIMNSKNKLVRPLLFANKDDILAYAKENNLSWREDSSNQSSKYQRNLIRHEVIPLLKKINPNLDGTIRQSVEKIAAAEAVFNQYVERLRTQCLKTEAGYITLDFSLLQKEEQLHILLFELLKPYGFSYLLTADIVSALEGIPGKKFFSETYCLVKDRDRLVITKQSNSDQTKVFRIGEHNDPINLPGNLVLSVAHSTGFKKDAGDHTAYLNIKKLSFPLLLRPWEAGDSFQPLGMSGKKKLSDFLGDLKIPLNLKDQILVLLSGDDIVWVAGHRVDERYKAEEGKESLVVEIK